MIDIALDKIIKSIREQSIKPVGKFVFEIKTPEMSSKRPYDPTVFKTMDWIEALNKLRELNEGIGQSYIRFTPFTETLR